MTTPRASVKSGNNKIGDDFDGKLASSGQLQVQKAQINPSSAAESKRIAEVEMALNDYLKDIGFPLDILGDVKIYVEPPRKGVRKGNYEDKNRTIAIGAFKKDGSAKADIQAAKETLLHELGHAVHHLYYPRWSYGDVNYSIEGKGYGFSPREAFANIFKTKCKQAAKKGKLSREVVSRIIRDTKKEVDADNKLNHIDYNHFDKVINEVKNTKVREKWKTNNTTHKMEKVKEKKRQILGVKNGKIYVIAENKD